MRIRHKVTLTIDEGTDGKNMLLSPDDDSAEVILNGPVEATVQRASILAAGVYAVPFGSVDVAEGFWIKSSGDFNLVVNGGTSMPVRRGISTATGGTKAASTKIFFEGAVTSIEITAVDDCAVTVAVWGDSVLP